MHKATEGGHLEVVKFLLFSGAVMEIKDRVSSYYYTVRMLYCIIMIV